MHSLYSFFIIRVRLIFSSLGVRYDVLILSKIQLTYFDVRLGIVNKIRFSISASGTPSKLFDYGSCKSLPVHVLYISFITEIIIEPSVSFGIFLGLTYISLMKFRMQYGKLSSL